MSSKKIKGLESVNPEIAKLLIDAGYKTAQAISISVPSDIVEDTGISIDTVEDIIARALAKVANPPISAAKLLKLEQERGKISTSSGSLDSLLAGGAWTGEITEIAGTFSTGKSQLCFQLAVNAQMPEAEGGLGGKIFFVDTEGTFSAMRVGEMALAKDLDPQEVLENILVARVLDSQHQTRMVQQVNEIAKEQNIVLVVVDSIAAHFRSDYIGNDRLPERQQRIMQHATSLTNLAYMYGMAVVVTNQMVQKVDNITGASQITPALGESWSHRPQTRIILRKSPGTARIARLSDSPRRAEGEEVFYITDSGIRDSPRS